MSVALPPGYALAAYDEIDSTNEEAKRRAEMGARGPIWITASRQTAGRGRRGRSWTSEPGNLFATLLLAPERNAADAARLSFAAALSVHALARSACPGADVKLKWPNDVLIGGAKCSGILLESGGEQDGVLPWLAVGIGVNLAHAPEGTPYPATALRDHGALLPPEAALTTLSHAWAGWFEVWRQEGFGALRRAWLNHAQGLGQPITARLADDGINGVFEGLDEAGSLQLRLGDGTLKAISSGEIFFGAR
jgi:BirA family transcriptional regulator, biotin operon repressor / biotin---[acetyl-CoA-carboxylase] ligase